MQLRCRGFRRSPPYRRSLFFLSIISALALGTPLHAQVIAGRLLDVDTDEPIPWGTVQLFSVDAEALELTVSDQDGYFALTAPDSGHYLLHAEAFLYFSIVEGPFELGPADTLEVTFRIPASPVELDPIVVEATRLNVTLVRTGFYDRLQRGLGRFLTRQDVVESHAPDMTSLLAMVPGVRMVPGSYGGMVPVFARAQILRSITQQGGRCFPTLYVDGVPMAWSDGDAGSGIDDLVTPHEVEGIELYRDPLETPTRYSGIGRAYCGVMVIWTRRR